MKNTLEYLQRVNSTQIIMSKDFEKLASKKINVKQTRIKIKQVVKKTRIKIIRPWACKYGYFVNMPIPQTLGIVSTI